MMEQNGKDSITRSYNMKRIKELIRNVSLFWRFLLLLTLIMGIFFTCQLITGSQYTNRLREEYLRQAENSFAQDCDILSSNVGLLYSLPAVLENSQDYSYISNYRGPIPNNRFFVLSMLRQSFAKSSALLQLQEDSFFVFRNSYCGSTRLRSFPNMQDCFSNYLRFEETDPDEIRQRIVTFSGIDILPVQNISINGGAEKEYMTVLLASPSAGSSLVIGVLYPVDTILDAFEVGELPESAWLRMDTKDGTPLLTYNTENANIRYHVFTHKIPTMGTTVSIGIPDDHFTSIIKPITRTTTIIIAAVYLLCIPLCILFSSISVQPMRRLISSYAPGGDSRTFGNELHTIRHLLVQNRQSQEQLSQSLLSGVLDRSFAGLPLDGNEVSQIETYFPHYFGAGRICIIRNMQEDHAGTGSEVLESMSFFTSLLEDDYYLKYVNKREFAILCKNSDSVESVLFQCLRLANLELQGKVVLVAGISLVFHGIREMENALYQAYSAVPLSHDLILNRYNEVSDTRKASTVTGQRLDQFYQALRQWDRKSAFAILDSLEAPMRHIPNPSETVNLFLFIIKDAADAAGIRLPATDAALPRNAHDGIKILRSALEQLFDLAEERYSGNQKELQRNILGYIGEHYSDCNLCIDSVASNFNISGSFISKTIPQLTGKPFNKYVVEVRMQAAAQMLRESALSIDEISLACGYPAQSTFYRVFKKYHGISPMQYRTGAQKKEDPDASL